MIRPSLLTAAITRAKEGEKAREEAEARASSPVHRARGSDERAQYPHALIVPVVKPPATPWVSTAESSQSLDIQLQPGMFVKAWIEPQSNIPSLKRASAALFYVIARGDLRSSGIDVDVELVGSRADTLYRALKEGPFPEVPLDGKSFLHLCTHSDCVGRPPPAFSDSGGTPITRVHAVAIQVFFKAELNEKWYSDGIKVLDRHAGKTLGYPAYAVSEGAAEEERRKRDERRRAAASVGGGRGPTLSASNSLGFDPAKALVMPNAATGGNILSTPPALPPGLTEAATAAAAATIASAQAEKALLEQAREQAQASLRAIQEATAKMEEATINSQRQQRALEGARETAKSNLPPGHSRSRRRSRKPSRRRDRSPTHKSRKVGAPQGHTSRGLRLPSQERHSQQRDKRSRNRSRRRGDADEGRPRKASPRAEARGRIPPRPSFQVPGLSTGGFGDALLDRKPGIYGALSPYFKAEEVIKWIHAQTEYSDAVRVQLMAVQRAERKRRQRRSRDRSRKRRKHSSHSRSRSSHSRSSSGAGEREKERERFKFRLIAKEKPGVTFATMVANSRQALGHFGVELDVGSHGPLFRKWWESSYTKEHPASVLKPYVDELQLLVTALDEFYAGRMVEVGDILASRLRYLTAGIDKNCFRAARHFLVYHVEDSSLVSEAMMDQALKIEENEARRQRRMATARGGAPRDR